MASGLSVACLTRGEDGRGAAILRLLRPVADEIVVALDSRAVSEAEAALAGVADALFRYPYAEPVERPRPWLYRQCTGRWLLIVDDDEIPSRALLDALPGLVAAADVTHYWLPRRWLYPSPHRYLDELPWRPDYQLRLVVNDPRLLRFPGELHWSLDAIGPGRFLDAPLYHVDLLIRSPEERRRKAARYEQLQPGKRIAGRPFNNAFYLPEDAGELRTAVLPAADRALVAATLAGAPAAGRRRARPTVETTRAEIDREWPAPVLSESAYAAELKLRDELTELDVGEVRTVGLSLRNLGDAIWPWGVGGRPEIRATYRWWRRDEVVAEGLRTPLPADLRPGQACLLPLAVQGPDEPGVYRLTIDLVHEHVRWFECGLAIDSIEVRARPRLAAVGPAVPPAGDVVLLVPDPESLRGRWAGECVRSLDAYLLDGLPPSRARAALVLVVRGTTLLRSAVRVRRGREPTVAAETLRALAGCDQLLLRASGTRRRERLATMLTALCARLLGVSVVADRECPDAGPPLSRASRRPVAR